MNISDELEGVDKLRKDGSLSKDEFAQAKQQRLDEPNVIKPIPSLINYRPPDPVNGDFSVQMVMVLLVTVLFFIFILLMWPHMRHWNWNG